MKVGQRVRRKKGSGQRPAPETMSAKDFDQATDFVGEVQRLDDGRAYVFFSESRFRAWFKVGDLVPV